MFRAPVLLREMPWRSDAGYVIDLDLYLRVLRQGDLWASRSLVSTFRVSIGSWSASVSGQQAGDFRTSSRSWNLHGPTL